jgi:hypothetical protein
MATIVKPADGYERYYTEKLWDLVPGIHRQEDGIAEHPGVLRAIVEILGIPAAVLRRDVDRLWDDEFIDLCDEWAVPYLGDLVGTRLVSALNARGRRVDVAKTVYYRRRKGTPRVLEELIGDISGWDGKLTESFRGLARYRHGLDPAPPPMGRWSGTPQGGSADLRDARAATLSNGAFDEYAHLADVRRQRGTDGLWNIPKVVFHLHRLVSYELRGVEPHARAGGSTFTFDPSGRDVPLFVPRRRLDDWDDWTSARPWELPAPMTCRLLGDAEYLITEAVVVALELAGLPAAAATELRTLDGVLFRNERRLRDHLAGMTNAATFLAAATYDAILREAITADSAKRHLLDPSEPALSIDTAPPAAPIAGERIAAGNLANWAAVVANKDAIVDPDRGRFKLLGAPPVAAAVRVGYGIGFSGDLGAGSYDRGASVLPPPKTLVPLATPGTAQVSITGGPPVDGVWEIADSATYSPIDDVADVHRLVLQAADLERPYVRLAADWVITAEAAGAAELVIDGIWFGAGGAFAIVLRGDWATVTLRHATLDPGGADADGAAIAPVRLWIEGTVDALEIDRSIVATVGVRAGGLLELVTITDSILDAAASGAPALAFSPVRAVMRRVTVLGAVDVERLDASEALITGSVDVTDTQDGCFRFSAAPAGSRLPHPYRSFTLADVHLFTSATFGAPGYVQLAEGAPVQVARGAENGSEMGAWSSLIGPIKQDSLAHKVDEYLPFGLVPCYVRST